MLDADVKELLEAAGVAIELRQAGILFQDEGSALGVVATATSLNFTGAGVTASRATNAVTVNIPGGGGGGGGSVEKTAITALGGHRAVIAIGLNGAGYADNTDVAHINRVIGITTGATIIGASVTVLTTGEMTEPSWSWTPYGSIYVSVNGLLTQTFPVTGFLQIIGIALSATTIRIGIQEPILLG